MFNRKITLIIHKVQNLTLIIRRARYRTEQFLDSTDGGVGPEELDGDFGLLNGAGEDAGYGTEDCGVEVETGDGGDDY